MNGLHHAIERVRSMGETDEWEYYWNDTGSRVFPSRITPEALCVMSGL